MARPPHIDWPAAKTQTPPCPVFEQCGGCQFQHVVEPAYLAYKSEQLNSLLALLSLDPETIRPMQTVGAASRRRVSLKLAKQHGKISLGFFAPKSHDVIDTTLCPVMETKLEELLEPLHTLLQNLKKAGKIKQIQLTLLDHGVDMLLELIDSLPTRDINLLEAFAQQYGLVRLSSNIKGQRDALIRHFDTQNATRSLGAFEVDVPVGSFLQASSAGEKLITDQLRTMLPANYTAVADIFSGLGTYSFALHNQDARYDLFEANHDMTIAATNAIRRTQNHTTMEALTRDLFKKPLSATELTKYDLAIINPPRDGAQAQCEALAQANVATILMVSCSPKTFARDASLLIAGGYALTTLQPIDQFYWSSHTELVAKFVRKA